MTEMPNMSELLAQAAAMQANMKAAQDEVLTQEFEGTAGGGVVKARVKGSGEVQTVEIDPSVINPDDPELLGDLVVAAVNQAMATATAAMQEQLGQASGGMDLDLDLGGLLGG
jgi:DNA-binding YbaB/EbfC family protein